MALDLILDLEGGGRITDDPADPGGLTRWGVSARAYPDINIRALSREDAAAIYRRDYWQALRCNDYPYATALMLFDTAVNQGKTAATRMSQSIIGVKVDGLFGPVTHAGLMKHPPYDFCDSMAISRLVAYKNNRNSSRYFKGWASRVIRILHEAYTAETG